MQYSSAYNVDVAYFCKTKYIHIIKHNIYWIQYIVIKEIRNPACKFTNFDKVVICKYVMIF